MSYNTKNTAQPPKTGSSTRMILAERAYIATSATTWTPAAKLVSTEPPSPWIDLGIVAGSKVEITYTKEIAKIETGIDKVLRDSYLKGKSASAKFTLEQSDMDVLEALSGLSHVDVSTIGEKIYIGQEDVVNKAVVFVGTNKLDGKELHTYSPNAGISYAFASQDDARVLEVTCDFYAFDPGDGTSCLFTLFILA